MLPTGSSRQLKKNSIPDGKVGHAMITPSGTVPHLGAILDTNLTLVPHVSAVCLSAHYNVRNIGKFMRFLKSDS